MYYTYANPHPKKILTGDCVVRAFSLAFNVEYLEMRRELNRVKRQYGMESYRTMRFMHKYLRSLKVEKLTIRIEKGDSRPTAKEFYEMFGDGVYLISMRRHMVTMIDGKILDTWDSSDRPIYTAWRIK